MPAKKIRSAPAPALLSDTALSVAPPFAPAPADGEGDQLADGLIRTLARRRDALEAPATTKASALAKLAKSERTTQPKPARGVRKTDVGPRSGHK